MSNIELKGLKGLRSLDNLINESNVSTRSHQNVQNLSIDFLIPGKYQPRKYFDDDTLRELSHSIKVQGIIQPLIVRKADNHYEIIAGERRWRAAKLVGFTHVPVLIREIEDNVALAYSLIENIQRADLNPIEEAIAFDRFKTEFSMTHADIGEMIGRSRVSVTNTLRLLTLSDAVQTMLINGNIDMSHARALLTLTPHEQIVVAEKIVAQNLTVRETERLINNKFANKSPDSNDRADKYKNRCARWSSELSQRFSSNVAVKLNSKGRGKIIISVDSPDEVDWLIENLRLKTD